MRIDCGDRIDLLVANRIIVELKAVAQLDPIHECELLTSLGLSGCHGGLLIEIDDPAASGGISGKVAHRCERVLVCPSSDKQTPRSARGDNPIVSFRAERGICFGRRAHDGLHCVAPQAAGNGPA